MAVRRMAQALLLSACLNSFLLAYAHTPYGASMIAFGLRYITLAIVWVYAVWREHSCLLPGLPRLCHHMAVCRMARVLLPLAWVTSSLPSYSCMSYGASIIAVGLGYLIFAIVWLNVMWREHYCLWPGSHHL